jgi:hypothetical protein
MKRTTMISQCQVAVTITKTESGRTKVDKQKNGRKKKNITKNYSLDQKFIIHMLSMKVAT